MRPLSAAEAISPAIERTKTVLFQPFKPGRSWKLAATAYLSALAAFFIPTPLFSFFAAAAHPRTGFAGMLFSMGFGTIFSAVMFVFFCIGARLEFSLFDIVLLNEKFVAPSWRRHGPQTWRWIGFKLIFSFIFAILCGPLLYIAFTRLLPQMAAVHVVPGQPPPPQLFANLMRIYAIIGVPFGLGILCSSLLTNFVLPSVALENTTVREGLRRFGGLITSEPGPFSLFVVLKVVLAIAGIMAMEFAIVIAELLGAIPLALVGVAGWFALRSAGDPGKLMMIAGGILLLVLFFVFVIFVSTLALGCLHTFFQAYALYFLGGRYPALGDLLEPPAPVVPYAAPQPPPIPPTSGILPIPPSEPAL
jgi:hypothetical protein